MKYYSKNTIGAWVYTLNKMQSFYCKNINFHDAIIYSESGKLIARMMRHRITLYAGYSWNGCNVIGRIIETEATLHASLLHDALYQIAKQADYDAPYSRADADAAFYTELPYWACLLWWSGVRLFAWAYWRGELNDLIIKKSIQSQKLKI